MTGDKLRTARKSLGLTQQQLAMVLGLQGQATIARCEAGNRNIGPTFARLVIAYLDGYRPDDWPNS